MTRILQDPAEMVQHAQKQREKAESAALKRKEEFLGARVPKELRNRVIARANELGIPVSILIRNILEEAFVGEHARAGKTPMSEVLGWKDIKLQRGFSCSACGIPLAKGDGAHFGLGASVATVLCRSCMERL